VDGLNLSLPGCSKLVFHLHGFYDDQDVALRHPLAFLHRDVEDKAWDGRLDDEFLVIGGQARSLGPGDEAGAFLLDTHIVHLPQQQYSVATLALLYVHLVGRVVH